jgi:hydroxyacylglutathione hydrolase
MSEEEFTKIVTEGQAAAPLYFSFAATRNRAARENLDEDSAPTALTWSEFQKHVSDGAIIVDSREPDEFARGHVRGSRNIGLSGRFAEYVGEVVRPSESIVLVSTPGTESEAKVRLARIGYDKVLGVLADPVRAMLEHPDDVRIASRVSAQQLESLSGSMNDLTVIDVRGPGELEEGAVAGSKHIQLASLLERVSELDPTSPTVVYCAGGYRSSIAASTLRSLGFLDVSDLIGGYGAWRTQKTTLRDTVQSANASRE